MTIGVAKIDMLLITAAFLGTLTAAAGSGTAPKLKKPMKTASLYALDPTAILFGLGEMEGSKPSSPEDHMDCENRDSQLKIPDLPPAYSPPAGPISQPLVVGEAQANPGPTLSHSDWPQIPGHTEAELSALPEIQRLGACYAYFWPNASSPSELGISIQELRQLIEDEVQIRRLKGGDSQKSSEPVPSKPTSGIVVIENYPPAADTVVGQSGQPRRNTARFELLKSEYKWLLPGASDPEALGITTESELEQLVRAERDQRAQQDELKERAADRERAELVDVIAEENRAGGGARLSETRLAKVLKETEDASGALAQLMERYNQSAAAVSYGPTLAAVKTPPSAPVEVPASLTAQASASSLLPTDSSNASVPASTPPSTQSPALPAKAQVDLLGEYKRHSGMPLESAQAFFVVEKTLELVANFSKAVYAQYQADPAVAEVLLRIAGKLQRKLEVYLGDVAVHRLQAADQSQTRQDSHPSYDSRQPKKHIQDAVNVASSIAGRNPTQEEDPQALEKRKKALAESMRSFWEGRDPEQIVREIARVIKRYVELERQKSSARATTFSYNSEHPKNLEERMLMLEAKLMALPSPVQTVYKDISHDAWLSYLYSSHKEVVERRSNMNKMPQPGTQLHNEHQYNEEKRKLEEAAAWQTESLDALFRIFSGQPAPSGSKEEKGDIVMGTETEGKERGGEDKERRDNMKKDGENGGDQTSIATESKETRDQCLSRLRKQHFDLVAELKAKSELLEEAERIQSQVAISCAGLDVAAVRGKLMHSARCFETLGEPVPSVEAVSGKLAETGFVLPEANLPNPQKEEAVKSQLSQLHGQLADKLMTRDNAFKQDDTQAFVDAEAAISKLHRAIEDGEVYLQALLIAPVPAPAQATAPPVPKERDLLQSRVRALEGDLDVAKTAHAKACSSGTIMEVANLSSEIAVLNSELSAERTRLSIVIKYERRALVVDPPSSVQRKLTDLRAKRKTLEGQIQYLSNIGSGDRAASFFEDLDKIDKELALLLNPDSQSAADGNALLRAKIKDQISEVWREIEARSASGSHETLDKLDAERLRLEGELDKVQRSGLFSEPTPSDPADEPEDSAMAGLNHTIRYLEAEQSLLRSTIAESARSGTSVSGYIRKLGACLSELVAARSRLKKPSSLQASAPASTMPPATPARPADTTRASGPNALVSASGRRLERLIRKYNELVEERNSLNKMERNRSVLDRMDALNIDIKEMHSTIQYVEQQRKEELVLWKPYPEELFKRMTKHEVDSVMAEGPKYEQSLRKQLESISYCTLGTKEDRAQKTAELEGEIKRYKTNMSLAMKRLDDYASAASTTGVSRSERAARKSEASASVLSANECKVELKKTLDWEERLKRKIGSCKQMASNAMAHPVACINLGELEEELEASKTYSAALRKRLSLLVPKSPAPVGDPYEHVSEMGRRMDVLVMKRLKLSEEYYCCQKDRTEASTNRQQQVTGELSLVVAEIQALNTARGKDLEPLLANEERLLKAMNYHECKAVVEDCWHKVAQLRQKYSPEGPRLAPVLESEINRMTSKVHGIQRRIAEFEAYLLIDNTKTSVTLDETIKAYVGMLAEDDCKRELARAQMERLELLAGPHTTKATTDLGSSTAYIILIQERIAALTAPAAGRVREEEDSFVPDDIGSFDRIRLSSSEDGATGNGIAGDGSSEVDTFESDGDDDDIETLL